MELHAHLDGGIDAKIAGRLLEILGKQAPPGLADMLQVSPACGSLEEFLQYFTFPLSLLQTKECIREAVYLEQEAMKTEGLLYGEIRFAPQLHTRCGLSQKEAVRAALEGLEQSDFPCNLILCCMRGRGNEEENEETVRQALHYRCENGGVTALDLAGDEAGYPTCGYRELFREVKNAHMPFTIHAGEAAGSESIRDAVEMGAMRIGHGTALYQDPQLMEEVKLRGITLEMCPTSNILTKAVTEMRKYPLFQYLEQGFVLQSTRTTKQSAAPLWHRNFRESKNGSHSLRNRKRAFFCMRQKQHLPVPA